MEARKEEKRESKGKRFGWRIDKLFNQRDTLSYKIFVFRSEKETTKREERKKVKRSGDVLVVTAKKIRKKKRCVKIRKRRQQNQSLCSFYSRNTNPCCLTERETRCSPLIKHNATFVIIVEVYFYENRSCRISSSIDLCAMFLPKDTNIVREGVAQSIPTWFASLRTTKNFENESGRNREGVEMWQMNPFLHRLGGKC